MVVNAAVAPAAVEILTVEIDVTEATVAAAVVPAVNPALAGVPPLSIIPLALLLERLTEPC